jgi:hypothetical protein
MVAERAQAFVMFADPMLFNYLAARLASWPSETGCRQSVGLRIEHAFNTAVQCPHDANPSLRAARAEAASFL